VLVPDNISLHAIFDVIYLNVNKLFLSLLNINVHFSYKDIDLFSILSVTWNKDRLQEDLMSLKNV